jgi:ketosteroid isomerase-like protein
MKSDDRLKIEELHQKDRKASLQRDYGTLVSLMDEAMILIPQQRAPLRGKQAVAENLKAYLEQTQGWKVTEYVHDFEEVEVAGDRAFEWGTYRGTVVPPGGQPIRETGKIVRILRRQPDGSWKVYRAMGIADQPSPGKSSQEEIRKIIGAINEAWTQGRVEELNAFFHDKIVMVSPTLQVLSQGREAGVSSYASFLKQAEVHKIKFSEPEIFLSGNTAVAGTSFDITWEAGGRKHEESGREVFVFSREEGRWLAVWRMMLPPDKSLK